MCLHKVDQVFSPANQETREGWKIVTPSLKSAVYLYPLKKDEWMDADNHSMLPGFIQEMLKNSSIKISKKWKQKNPGSIADSYSAGFHVYQDKTEADGFCSELSNFIECSVVKVAIKEIVAEGSQANAIVWVAKKLKVL